MDSPRPRFCLRRRASPGRAPADLHPRPRRPPQVRFLSFFCCCFYSCCYRFARRMWSCGCGFGELGVEWPARRISPGDGVLSVLLDLGRAVRTRPRDCHRRGPCRSSDPFVVDGAVSILVPGYIDFKFVSGFELGLESCASCLEL